MQDIDIVSLSHFLQNVDSDDLRVYIDRVFFSFFYVLCVLAANVSTKKRVIYFTLAEYIVFAAASALQVVYIRNLFSKTVGYNRV